MSKAKENILTIQVTGDHGHIPVASFIEVIRDSLQILAELDSSISEQSEPTLNWDITGASLNSPLLLTVAAHPQNGLDIGNKVIQSYVDGLEQIERGSKTKPRYFSDVALYKAKRMVSVLNQGIREIAFSTPDGLTVTPSTDTAKHVDSLLDTSEFEQDSLDDFSLVEDGETDVDRGTEESRDLQELGGRIIRARIHPRKEEKAVVVGKLEGINVHGGKSTFVVYDPLTNTKINCTFPDEDLEKVKEALPYRVSITGTATYNAKGQVTSIKVETFRKLRQRKDLPQARDLERINFTGGLDPVEYIRSLRDA